MSDSEHSECEYEIMTRKNIEENRRKMMELGLYRPKPKPELKQKTLKSSNCAYKENPERRSARRTNAGNAVTFSEEVARQILGDTNCCYITWGDDLAADDDLDPDFKSPEKRKKMSLKPRVLFDKLSVEEITEDHLKNIAQSSRFKVYSKDGTTCHQCRQKTTDQKTICRSSKCIGVRGQFCGPCLKNRYGEFVAESLKNPNWICPPCRNMCNCSICRTNAGKIPTGQLAYAAQVRGYKSVKQLLEAEDES